MDKAVKDFIINNLKNVAQYVINEVEEETDLDWLMREYDAYEKYERNMLWSGRGIYEANEEEKNHIEGYVKLLETILYILIYKLYGRENLSDICNRALAMTEKYSNPKEQLENDKETIYKILIGEK